MATAITTRPPRFGVRRALRMPDWGAAGWAGIVAGGFFMGCEMALLPAQGVGAWEFVRMVAAIIYGRPILSATEPLGAGAFLIAMGLHFSLSVIYLRLVSGIIYQMGTAAAVALGTAFGVALYLLNFHLAAPAMFPWFVEAQGWASLASNTLFGASAAMIYKLLERREPLVEDPREERPLSPESTRP